MIRRTFRLVGVVVLLVGPVAAAEPAKNDFGRTGWYVGGGATYAFENFSSGGVSVDDSAGFKLQGGYRAHPNFAAEAESVSVERIIDDLVERIEPPRSEIRV